MTSSFLTRFAPSPTGHLHIGHAYSAYCAFSAAREAGGECLLRIEDTDQTRCKPEFEEMILKDLCWLGYNWPSPVRRQSQHLNAYGEALKILQDRDLVYRCFKTRREITDQIALAPHDAGAGELYGEKPFFGAPLDAREEAGLLEQNKPYAWRLNMKACKDSLNDDWEKLSFFEEGAGPNGEKGRIKATPEIFGDAILARKDTGTSYHMACVHDDGLQGITHIIRGTDLFAVTHLHVLLQNLLGLNTPIYRHHPLLTDDAGKRFAKRDQAKTLAAMREEGMIADNVRELMKSYL